MFEEAGEKLTSSVSLGSMLGGEEGASRQVRYICLDRVPVRSIPRGYVPSVGVTLVDDRQVREAKGACC